MSAEDQITLKLQNAVINDEVKESLRLIEDLKFFLATAPANWQNNQVIRRYYLNHDEGFVSCIFWNNLYFITGTDIVRCIVYKFQHFGRKILDRKKFEEGIFSDLRNLKTGSDAILEPPKSEFLNFLYKNSCLRTQKKQKVFFWFNVPHDKLMADALERDIKKEKSGQQPTTIADREPAISFDFDEEKLLYNHLVDQDNNKFYSSGNDTTDDANTTTSTTITNSNHDDEEKTKPANETNTTNISNIEGNTATGEGNTTIGDDDIDNEDNEDNKRKKSKDKKKKKDKVTFDKGIAASPEYTTTNLTKNDENFAFLNQETPDQHKIGSDDEDDFPLDYFEENSNDYITIDASIPNYPPFFDNANPEHYAPYSTNQVVSNDEFLIEQTLPLKTPIPIPFSAKFPTSSNSEEYYNFPPLSSRYQTFPRSVMDQPPLSALTPNQPFYPMIQPLSASQPYYPPGHYFPPPPHHHHQLLQSVPPSQQQSQPQSSHQDQTQPPSQSQLQGQGQAQGQSGNYQLPPPIEHWQPYPDPSVMNQPYVLMNENNEPVYQVMNPQMHPYYQPYPPPPQMGPPPQLQAQQSQGQGQSKTQSQGQGPASIPSVTGPPTTTQTITIPPSFHGPMAATSSPYGPAFTSPYHPSFIMSPNFQGPSQRQQNISASMMKKKHQMLKPPPLSSIGTSSSPSQTQHFFSGATNPLHFSNKSGGISKPKNPRNDLKTSIGKALRIEDKNNDTLIPTPESTIGQSDKKSQ